MHDYEIRDLLRRAQVPELVADIAFEDGSKSTPYPRPGFQVAISIKMGNISSEPSLYNMFGFLFDTKITVENAASYRRMPDLFMSDVGALGRVSLSQLQMIMMVPNDFPLVKGARVTIGPPFIAISISEPYFSRNQHFLIGYDALTSGFQKRRFAPMSLISNQLMIGHFFDNPTPGA
jgi:hypothetical protein